MSRPAECYAQAMLELQYPMDVVEQAHAALDKGAGV